ncbi:MULTISPECIES: hypothetical protein [Leptolyngbya]|jgi:hypothetical protein|uniref:Uncharacterized protein n=2 Tax=Leptolyngbya boryana TaxID=1184 RepID=A0A1Z4JMQ0_LEPBY|nr:MULTISPECIES: hypothetical protein [Leptolyngbya]BAY57897.1 hypothetical protein NIES2135_47690 [Leptolyngbya boryana NIES-2135]MBD1854535.1 hypothetical protein [Leptolyngbya sp. FACHB-1624]MBD2367342.1 hypothetical protein [Leptolyngbya sp. FACHB-161]MBD2373866.1 hypothetical protein [Leptolyngbya sp. FACHB-238]MBD2398334.1 hypothetical protein [Leptolyngbya sp. FACHB-239]
MNLQEFESQTRNNIERALTQLQTATLLLSALEIQILESGDTVKNLSLTIEQFINTQQDSETTIV